MPRKRSSDFNVRQYMVERDFEIYYYSDVHFHSVGNHSHNYYEFYFFESGAVTMETAGKSFALKQGDLLVLPPGVEHRATVTDDGQPYRRFVFWIGSDYLTDLTEQAEEYGYLTRRAEKDGACLYHFDLLTFNSIRIQLFSLLDELHTQRYGRQERLRLEVRSLLLLLNRLVHEQREARNPKDEKNKYALISAYIDEHLAEPLTVEKIAGENRTETHVRALDHDGRVHELSRLVGGASDSESSLSHAAHMLAEAAETKRAIKGR